MALSLKNVRHTWYLMRLVSVSLITIIPSDSYLAICWWMRLQIRVTHYMLYLNVGRNNSVGTATRYGLDGPGDRILVGASVSAPVQIRSEAHPASYTKGTGSFPGIKRPRRGVDHPHPSRAEVKYRGELYLYSPSGLLWLVLEWTLTCTWITSPKNS